MGRISILMDSPLQVMPLLQLLEREWTSCHQDADTSLCILDLKHLRSENDCPGGVVKTWQVARRLLYSSRNDSSSALQAWTHGKVDGVLWSDDPPEKHRTIVTACLKRWQQDWRFKNALPPRWKSNWLITGASGFLGGVLVRNLLEYTDIRMTLLSRASRGMPAEQRFAEILANYPDRVHIVEGDITRPYGGLAAADLLEIQNHTEEIWHLAADTRFEASLRGPIFRSNLDGTRNLLDLARTCSNLRRFVFVSTAFSCGVQDAEEPVQERLMRKISGFRNHYEESKYVAEQAVFTSGLPFLLFRPSIILGDSLTARNDGKTIYNVAKMVRMAKFLQERDAQKGILDYPLRIVARKNAAKNLIPVDTVAEWMLRIAAVCRNPENIFHLTHPDPVPMECLVGAIANALEIQEYEFIDEYPPGGLSPGEKLLQKVVAPFTPYMTASDPIFDRLNSDTLRGDMIIPRVDHDLLLHLVKSMFLMLYGEGYASHNRAISPRKSSGIH